MSFYEDHIFPRLLDLANLGLKRDRERLFSRASGNVLEIGMGNGASIPFYDATRVQKLTGIEPNAAMLQEADTRWVKDGKRFACEFVEGSAHALPFADSTFDCVVFCLVLCTIPNPALAIREVRRVLKPGGHILVFEHIRSHKPRTAKLQKALNPAWQRFACGCDLTRDTVTTLRENGVDVSGIEVFEHPKVIGLLSQMITGNATIAK